MKKILIVVSAALAIASFTGCKKKAGGDSGAALAKMTEFKDKMCKCTDGDAECAKKVSDEMMKWGESQPKPKEGVVAKADPKAEEVGKQMGECMTKAMTPKMADPAMGGSAAVDPAAGSAAVDPAAGSGAAPAGGSAAMDGSAVAPAGSADDKK
ncbi:MAG: hypothetical protein WKG01_35910 [Kofleriaceae bacterium]